MLYVTYDIHDDKTRTKFGKFLQRFGRRIQYSVFEIKNSPRVLRLVQAEIEGVYAKKFTNADNIIIIPVSDADAVKIQRYGFPAQEEEEILFL